MKILKFLLIIFFVSITSSKNTFADEAKMKKGLEIFNETAACAACHILKAAGSEGNIGGFSSNWYWSSSESNNYGAYDVNFSDGSTGNFSSKTKIVRVRVIRSF